MNKLLNPAFLEWKVVSRLTSIPKCWLLKCFIENLHWLLSWVHTKHIEKRRVVFLCFLAPLSLTCKAQYFIHGNKNSDVLSPHLLVLLWPCYLHGMQDGDPLPSAFILFIVLFCVFILSIRGNRRKCYNELGEDCHLSATLQMDHGGIS